MMEASSGLEDKIAWAILQALHENVPEADRPMAWSDMNEEQEKRIRAAARAAMLAVADSGFIQATQDLGRAQGIEEAMNA